MKYFIEAAHSHDYAEVVEDKEGALWRRIRGNPLTGACADCTWQPYIAYKRAGDGLLLCHECLNEREEK